MQSVIGPKSTTQRIPRQPVADVIYPTFAKYRTRTRRVIHIVELTPIADH
ncbi:MAG TPA: hypothetical protein VN812_07015 [Candidatus Acidoferrales bacterium]|nr:hypothetical protein [Candidatus Acidoferrales bacterium]